MEWVGDSPNMFMSETIEREYTGSLKVCLSKIAELQSEQKQNRLLTRKYRIQYERNGNYYLSREVDSVGVISQPVKSFNMWNDIAGTLPIRMKVVGHVNDYR